MIATLEHAGEPSAVGTRITTLVLFLPGAAMQQSGWKPRWFADADPETIKVAGDANGSLLEQLLSQTGYHDVACVELLRKGACMINLASTAPILLSCIRPQDDWWVGAQRSG